MSGSLRNFSEFAGKSFRKKVLGLENGPRKKAKNTEGMGKEVADIQDEGEGAPSKTRKLNADGGRASD